MSELRYNAITRDWVIIARERAKRPVDFKKKASSAEKIPPHKADCPFCPGNEGDRSDETYHMGEPKAWKVRAIYNKFPALSHTEKPTRNLAGAHKYINGFGIHEVLIEHPLHNISIPFMSDEEAANIIRMYKARYEEVERIPGVDAVIIFKNHGFEAGSSQVHPHSQLIATPMVPPNVRLRIEQAARFSDISGECIFCDTMKQELASKERIVFETDNFVAYVPYAALMPFIVWVLPRRHTSSFDDINEAEIRDLARTMKTVLGKLYSGLGDPAYNYTIRSIPPKEKGNEYFHWHINIVPRINLPAGFELGSGIFINSSVPEDCAEFLRKSPSACKE